MSFNLPKAELLQTVMLVQAALCDEAGPHTLSSGRSTHFTIDGGVMLENEVGYSLLQRLFALPTGEPYRCHVPRYAISAEFADGEFLVVAICWECNNISLNDSGRYDSRTFDGECQQAQELLRDVKRYFASPSETTP